MKRLFAIALVLVLLFTASAIAEPFRVGMECGYAPFNWSQVEATEDSVPIDGNQGYAGGYDVEIAKRIAEGLGRELVIVKLEWDGLIPALNAGIIDAVISEGEGPAHENPEAAIAAVRDYVREAYKELADLTPDELVAQRQERFARF